jgi:hypothetical protein
LARSDGENDDEAVWASVSMGLMLCLSEALEQTVMMWSEGLWNDANAVVSRVVVGLGGFDALLARSAGADGDEAVSAVSEGFDALLARSDAL